MKTVTRYLITGAAAIVVIAALGLSLIYVVSGQQLRRSYDAPLRAIAVPAGAEAIAEGRRLATVRGCNDGCHGKGVSGGEFWYEPWVGRMVAPDLTRVAADYSDSELERVIRRGVRKDGRSTWGMPSPMFYHLTDADLGVIIAYLRSLPVGTGPETAVEFGPLGRIELLMNPAYAYAEEIARDAPWMTESDALGQHARGRYLAVTVCSECHGMDLAGATDGTAPDLAIAAAYTDESFARLMRTGSPIGERELGLMGEVARVRFSQLTDDEVQALFDYLQARAKGFQ